MKHLYASYTKQVIPLVVDEKRHHNEHGSQLTKKPACHETHPIRLLRIKLTQTAMT